MDAQAPADEDMNFQVGGNPAPRPIPNHLFIMADPLTQDQLNRAEEITSQGDSKMVHTNIYRYATRTALNGDLLAYRSTNSFQHIFALRNRNLLTNYCFWRSDEADKNLLKYKAIISEKVALAFEYAYVDPDERTGHERRVWASDLAQAVMFLHSQNTVHGCIELSRVFLVDGILKLHLIPYQFIPRPRSSNYTADEVRNGQIQVPTKESDVYSTAAVAYFILNGQEPPPNKSGLLFAVVPPEIHQTLVEAWLVNPAVRPSAQEMFDALCRGL